jgi:hypothetical protein
MTQSVISFNCRPISATLYTTTSLEPTHSSCAPHTCAKPVGEQTAMNKSCTMGATLPSSQHVGRSTPEPSSFPSRSTTSSLDSRIFISFYVASSGLVSLTRSPISKSNMCHLMYGRQSRTTNGRYSDRTTLPLLHYKHWRRR